MKSKVLALAGIIILSASACNKDDNNDTPATDFNTLKTEVLKDFTNNVALAGYQDLDQASIDLNNSIQTLEADPTQDNLLTARKSWKDMRGIWEQCEGFLFGPVEDNDYDPNMDTWPTDHAQMDSLLASTNPLEVSDIQGFTLSLRGYHPIEYILFGVDGNKNAADITPRQKKYISSLSADLKNTCHALYTSWTSNGDFANEVINAGNGSTKYAKKQEVYLAIVGGMVGICEEVGEGKMKEPFDAHNPAIVESPYSGNSLIDFKNNIIGLQNVYMGKYKVDGKGLNELVAAKNKDLDNTIQNQLNAAISSFDNVTVPYGEAIITQRNQVSKIMENLATLKTTLEDKLQPFVIQYITD